MIWAIVEAKVGTIVEAEENLQGGESKNYKY